MIRSGSAAGRSGGGIAEAGVFARRYSESLLLSALLFFNITVKMNA